MEPTVTVLASGLNLLSFQGVTVFQDAIIVATVEGDLVRVAPDGTLVTWVNVERYGIPAGIVGLQESVIVALSAQELGHSLVQVTKQSEVSSLADLSDFAGDFGAPFAVAASEGYYPFYLVAVSTDVLGSAGLIVRVTRSGRTTVLTPLDSTSFGIGIGEDYIIATQENGQVLRIAFTGETKAIADLQQADLGAPLDITRLGDRWMTVTTAGWLVALKPNGMLSPIINIAEMGEGLPTTLTTLGNQLIVATQAGKLLRIEV
ncbi:MULTISPECIES: hypothetical protein [unclassified Leptolyngbya]|uniref:hypothetical protein n=1 Tax=unclassified Leptolyngbya TaxID=2650499 RepID=UPI0016822C9C|nr:MULTISPECIES: hypothetical protein [unclassified Leptolyngbya]MBD1912948.1 hypothetical protein [Leptolyngbya sp. FACHB-8]MBD2154723.1 hypothetical protein [Leptolyngbya sp. FACHB-16]